ncbi:MAG TPA: AAA family ATPase, partial [Acidimicrobiales bacterium]|nr:AAA family ATPase [Acidimicrobiales bacterium]
MNPGAEAGTAGGVVLVEREAELAALTSAFEAATRGEGSFAVIAGPAGMGKSALAARAGALARALGLTVRSARGSEIEQGFSFGVVRQLLERVVQSAPAEERRRLLSGAARAAARLFADAPIEPTAGDGGFATLHGIYWLTAGMAADRPLVLCVDDAQWADGPSLRALSFLASRITDLPVALVVTVRTHEPSAEADLVAQLESHPAARRLDLAPLGPDGVAAIVRAEAEAADDGLCEAFHHSSAGNPLYVRELIRSIDWRAGLPTAEAVRTTAASSVAQRVMGRVASLGPDVPRLAAAMAVLGPSGRLRDAACVAELGEPAAASAARAMSRAEILGGDDPFEWIHPIVRRSIYDSLDVTERDALHARAAKVLGAAGGSSDAVAAHLSALRPAGSARVTSALVSAADDALARDAPEVAVALLRRAIDEKAPDPPRAGLLLQLGQVQVTSRDPGAEVTLQEALTLSDEPRHRALATLAMVESYVFEGRWDAAAEMSERCLDDLAGLEQELVLELELARALVCMFDPALVRMFEKDRSRLEELARGDSWPARALSAALAMMSAHCGRDLGQVRALCAHAMGDGALIAERGAGAYAPGHVLGALIAVEEPDAAREFAQQVEAAARAQGSIANRFVARANLGRLTVLQGDLAEGEEIMRPLVDTAAQNGMALLVVLALWWMLEVIVERPS